MPYSVRKATFDDILYLSTRLRAEDVAELKAMSGRNPLDALTIGYQYGRSWVGVDEDGPYGIYGVVTRKDDDRIGVPWMVATDRLESHQKQFLKECKSQVEMLASGYDLLTNFVDARNTLHIRWLRWCGFTFVNLHKELGAERRPFWEFIRISHV